MITVTILVDKMMKISLTMLVKETNTAFGDDVNTVTCKVVSTAGSLTPLTVGLDDGCNDGCDDGCDDG